MGGAYKEGWEEQGAGWRRLTVGKSEVMFVGYPKSYRLRKAAAIDPFDRGLTYTLFGFCNT